MRAMPPDTLRAIGEALFGVRWQTPLARALGVSRQTVDRWMRGIDPILPERAAAMKRLCADRRGALREIERALWAAGVAAHASR